MSWKNYGIRFGKASCKCYKFFPRLLCLPDNFLKSYIRLSGIINEPRHNKTNKVSLGPAKTQISLGIHPDRLESSLCAQWVAKDLSFLHADPQAHLSPCWAHSHFVGFVMSRLKY